MKATVLPLGCLQAATQHHQLPAEETEVQTSSSISHLTGIMFVEMTHHRPTRKAQYHIFPTRLVSTSFSRSSTMAIRPSFHLSSTSPAAWWEEDAGKANTLNTFFVRQPSRSAADGEPPSVNAPPIPEDSQLLTPFDTSLAVVGSIMRTLTRAKAPGCDSIPILLFVMIADELAPCVRASHLFFELQHWLSTTSVEICHCLPNRRNEGMVKWLPTTGNLPDECSLKMLKKCGL